ncbi:MAG: RodZ domain-containing protein [Woeseia sp.]
MTDESTTPPDGGDSGPLAGERLAEARLKREISIHDIAKELHLDEYKVRLLEENAFEMLGAPVFSKGYLRKYAELVGIPADDILADYYRLNRSAAPPPIVGQRAKPPRDIRAGPWIAGLLAIAVVAGAAWWWLSSGSEWFANRSEPATLTPFAGDSVEQGAEDNSAAGRFDDTDAERPGNEPLQGTPAEGPLAEAETAGSDSSRDDAAAATGALASGNAAGVQTDSAQTPARASVELSLAFSGDCWTEVTDAAGERLFFGLGSAGRAVTVEGQPPLQVLLGDSANARLAVNGSDFPIPRSARRGATARLTIADR